MKPIKSPVVSSLLAAFCSLAIFTTSVCAQTYHVTPIDLPADQSLTLPAAINIQAEIAGTSGDFAFRYAQGMKQNLGSLPGGKFSRGFGINLLGDVAGDSTFNGGGAVTHATLFAKGEAIDLGTLAKFGDNSIARGVNDSRQVVGYAGAATPSELTRGFLWDPMGGIRTLPTLGGDYSQALAISNSHLVTGNAQLSRGSPIRHAFLWSARGDMRDLGTLGGASSYGTSVNDAGHIVGYSEVNARGTGETRVQAFFFDGSRMSGLRSPGAKAGEIDHSAALGINSRDEIVGSAFRSEAVNGQTQFAFIYRGGTMFDLNKLVDESGQTYQLLSAMAINDAGVIIVQARQRKSDATRALLLTPVSTH